MHVDVHRDRRGIMSQVFGNGLEFAGPVDHVEDRVDSPVAGP